MKVNETLASGDRLVKIAGLGDSITGVYYHTGGRRAWTEMLGLALQRLYPLAKLETINAGLSGTVSGDGLRRLEKDVLAHHPDVVVVMFGMNDVARATPEAYETNLRQIVDKCRAAGAEVVLCTPNTIGTDASRPMDKLRAHAEIVRRLAAELQVPLADCFAAYEAVGQRNPRELTTLMSDNIHPNMRGHKLFAEVMAETITGRRVSLADVGPLPGLPHVAAKLAAKQTFRVVAMPPYDALITPALQALYPDAQVEVERWETADLSLAQLEASAKARGWMGMRDNPNLPRPDLVIFAIPAAAQASDFATFHHHYTWTLNWSLSFGRSEWDAIAIPPAVTDPAASATEAQANAL
ncbi:MAG: SGNH/GDSL hydrolase family protein [Armatimonadia bacterium]